MTLTLVSLFAGVGGFDLAARNAGIATVATVEIDKQAQGVLRHHFPAAAHFSDVRTVTADDLRAAGYVPRARHHHRRVPLPAVLRGRTSPRHGWRPGRPLLADLSARG